MATLAVDDRTVVVELTRAEKVLGLHGDLRIPLDAIRGVEVVDDPLAAAQGLRAPGLGLPGVAKIGTWRGRARRQLVVARRHQPGLRLRLAPGAGPDEVVLGHAEAERWAGWIREALGVDRPAGLRSSHEVRVPADEVTLAGTLQLPGGDGPHPVALILPGSGPIDRDGNMGRMRIDVSRQLAAALAAAGVASLRYDKRGVGATGGAFLAAGLDQNLADARAALAWLRGRPELRGDAVFLVGHSEGAGHAIELAGDPGTGPVAGVVLLACSAKPGVETLAWQTAQVVPTLPVPVRALLRLLRIDLVTKQRANVDKVRATTSDVDRVGGRRINARWHRQFLGADPRPALARTTAPVLAITGDKDLQVDPADLDVIAATVAGPVRTERPSDLTHLLRRDPAPPKLGRYKALARQPVDPHLLELVTSWVGEQVPAPAA